MLTTAPPLPGLQHAHLAGFPTSLPDKLQSMAYALNVVWHYVFQQEGAQLTPATDNVIGAQPVSCGSTQVTTDDAPGYCSGDSALELPVGYFATNVEPLGDAATLLLVAETYGLHLEDALQAFNDGYSDAQLKETSACLAGIFFDEIPVSPTSNSPYLQPQDLTAVNSEFAREAAPSGSGSVTATDLITAFNRGIGAVTRYRECLPASAGGP